MKKHNLVLNQFISFDGIDGIINFFCSIVKQIKSMETEPPHIVMRGEGLISCDAIRTIAYKIV
jgi:hypothetical protein